jgi:uncharacterized membrane protein YecN with MAPEG domain
MFYLPMLGSVTEYVCVCVCVLSVITIMQKATFCIWYMLQLRDAW